MLILISIFFIFRLFIAIFGLLCYDVIISFILVCVAVIIVIIVSCAGFIRFIILFCVRLITFVIFRALLCGGRARFGRITSLRCLGPVSCFWGRCLALSRWTCCLCRMLNDRSGVFVSFRLLFIRSDNMQNLSLHE